MCESTKKHINTTVPTTPSPTIQNDSVLKIEPVALVKKVD